MKLTVQEANNHIAVVSLDGDLTLDCSESVKATMTDVLASRRKAVVFDMSRVRFIDSHGLELLLGIRDTCQLGLIPFRLAGLDETCSTILRITRLCDEFVCSRQVADAVKGLP